MSKNSKVSESDIRRRGRNLVTRLSSDEKILQLSRKGFTGHPNTAVTDPDLLNGPYGKSGAFYRITVDEKPLEYYVDGGGQLHIPTKNLDVKSTREVTSIAKRLVAIHGDPQRPNFTRNGVSVRDLARNLWEHALIAQGKHASTLANMVGTKKARVADVNNDDWFMKIAEIANVGVAGDNRRYDAVRRDEEVTRRLKEGAPVDDLYGDSEEGVVDPETGDFLTGSQDSQSYGTQQAAKAGDTEGPNMPVEEPVPQPTEPVPEDGPRIVINPEVFEDKRDALCVAMNEAFRVLMEMNGFNPVSEPTEAQRQFFADTAYNQNENQMRRTILARICTFDTSVKDPTEEQLAESVEFLETVMEMGAPQNQWEQQAVQRIHDVLVAALEQGTVPGGEAPAEEAPVDTLEGDERQEQAAVGGGQAFGGINDEEDKEMKRQADEMKAEGLTSVNEDTSTLEEREAYLRERGMDTDLAQYGSMSSLVKLHEQEVNGTYGDPKAAALEAANKEDAAEFVKFNDPSRELTENEKDAAEFVKFNDPGRGETTEKGPNPAPGVNDNGDANEFVKNAEEPAGPTRIRGHFRDEDGRVISQRTAQKLWDEAHNRSKDVTEVVKNTEELRPGGGQNVASTTAWDYRQKNGSGRQLTREEQEQHERTASTAAWAERTGNVNQVEDDEFKV